MPVALHDLRPAHEEFIIRAELHFNTGERLSDRGRMVADRFGHRNHRGRFREAIALAEIDAHRAEEFRDGVIQGSAARDQITDTAAEKGADPGADLRVEIRPRGVIQFLARAVLHRKAVLAAESAPAHFLSPGERLNGGFAFGSDLIHETRMNLFQNSRHGVHRGGLRVLHVFRE